MYRTSIVGLACALLIALAPASTASASKLLTLRDDGTAVVREDPYLPASPAPFPDAGAPADASAPPAAPAALTPRAGARRTVRGELKRMLAAGAITREAHDGYRSIYFRALQTRSKLQGTRRAALGATISNLERIAATGQLTVSRLPALLETVRRNREWWTTGPLLGAGQRVSFHGSRLVWQYYPGQGLQIQWLGSFGKANALWSVTKQDATLRELLDEALSLASQRAGGIAWEYLFTFDGGSPPWVSGLAQGTAIQALARAGVKLNEPRYTEAARAALGVFHQPPPVGVRIRTPAGAHYLIYSFAPGMRVLNAFTQALNGLYDYTALTNDPDGRALFAAGDKQLRVELPLYDTGAWSRYSPGLDADLGYHTLARDFLRSLCSRLTKDGAVAAPGPAPTGGAAAVTPTAPVAPGADPAPYCAAAQRFTAYLTRPPTLKLVSRSVRAGSPALVKLKISKPAYVKVALSRGGRVAAVLSAQVSSGTRSLRWASPRAGNYDVAIRATDLAGNDATVKGSLRVLQRRGH